MAQCSGRQNLKPLHSRKDGNETNPVLNGKVRRVDRIGMRNETGRVHHPIVRRKMPAHHHTRSTWGMSKRFFGAGSAKSREKMSGGWEIRPTALLLLSNCVFELYETHNQDNQQNNCRVDQKPHGGCLPEKPWLFALLGSRRSRRRCCRFVLWGGGGGYRLLFSHWEQSPFNGPVNARKAMIQYNLALL